MRKKRSVIYSTKKQDRNRYKDWESITDIKRSFWVWKGRYNPSPKESEIFDILKSHNLRFYKEVSFDLCKRFDFYIPLLDLVIEYDGSQHFSSLIQMRNDVNKELILKQKGVKLIRYNKTHNIKEQIAHDLIYHPVIVSSNDKH